MIRTSNQHRWTQDEALDFSICSHHYCLSARVALARHCPEPSAPSVAQTAHPALLPSLR
ncbi:hypothetical protein K491DRAFT_693824 [Lophiostoma macrostomum CBS 122681]|uniref:Uncharacterized protein n=1 Tax=Lophiostoma macrostomum CBS 122681 TaxID=1314788 RepID=A0A6A6T422_9PLEO|nr:hypothetical protein K491DRAFT_693824 [Lophiostoma macrostomum CBS 122681]